MALRVDKKLSALENMFKLVQHTWPEETDALSVDHVEISGAGAADDGTGRLQVTLTGISDGVVGSKTVFYTATDLATTGLEGLAVDAIEEAPALVEAMVAELPCLASEIEIGEAQEVEENLFRIPVVAVTDSYTVYGQTEVEVAINQYPLNLGEDLEGDELDGFGQVVPVVRTVELPVGGDIVLAEGDTFQYGVNFDGDEVAALELDIIIANPQGGLDAKEQFTIYADVDNPYGNSTEDFEAMGVSVAYAKGSWSIDFGQNVTAALAASGEVRIYAALRGDDKGKLWGDMMAPTSEMVRRFNISFE